jgi:transcription termination factor Rho
MAEELGVEGASTMRKQDLMFSILKVRAEDGEPRSSASARSRC